MNVDTRYARPEDHAGYIGPPTRHPSRNIPASADFNRQKRRALIKAIGARQFKKLYRKAQA